MCESIDDTEGWLNRYRAGDPDALNALIGHTRHRLFLMARRMLRGYADVRRHEDTDDVLQCALIRLENALRAETPNSARHYYNLAATQIRRQLIDLARHYRGPRAMERRLLNQCGHDGDDNAAMDEFPAALGDRPEDLEEWTRFHETVERLPDQHRELFALLHYERMNQQTAAQCLGISSREVRRRWQSARLALRDLLADRPPTEGESSHE